MVKLEATGLTAKFNEYAAFVLKDGYKYDKENTDAVNACIDVFRKNETGLTIIGNPGSGKTLFFEMMQKIIHPQSPRAFVKVNTLDVVLDFNNKNVGHNVFQRWKNKNVFFDDLGTESMGYLYGEKVEVFEKFIQFRYELFRSGNIKTHFTTNNGSDYLKSRYGMRCFSRMNEMCSIVMMGEKKESKDRREYKNFLTLPQVRHEPIKTQDELEWEDRYKMIKEAAKIAPQPSNEYKGLGQRIKQFIGTK